MYDFQCLALLKAENPEAYKKLAEEGIMVGHSVTIGGQTHRPDIGLPFHATVKFFDPSKDNMVAIHDVARRLKFTPPDPKKTGIEPGIFKDRSGNDVYVIKLHGEHANQIAENNSKFSHMGHPSNFQYIPHVSVDKQTWQGIVNSGAKTAHEAGIEFGHAQLKQGHKVVTTYRHGGISSDDKLAASEKMIGEPMNKGIKEMAGAAAMAGIIGLATPIKDATPAMAHTGYHQAPSYDSKKMLRAISQVESSGGKFSHHRQLATNGIHQGEAAFGQYGLTPLVIRETVRMNPSLKSKYGKIQHLEGQDLHNFMQDNPGLEDKVAEKHLARLEHHFGKDPSKIGYAWLEGITGTYKAAKEKKDINEHWHVKKINSAYKEQK